MLFLPEMTTLSVAVTVTVPPGPAPNVLAVIPAPPVRVSLPTSTIISPPRPCSVVLDDINTAPSMSKVGAVINIPPAFPRLSALLEIARSATSVALPRMVTVSVALMCTSPPGPGPWELLSILAPPVRVSVPTCSRMSPARPLPEVPVNTPLGESPPRPEIATESVAVIVTFPPCPLAFVSAPVTSPPLLLSDLGSSR